MNQLVRFLFGHEQAVFTNGRFGFDVRPSAVILVLIVLLAAASFISFIYDHAFVYQEDNRSTDRTARHNSSADGDVVVAAGRGCRQ